MDYYVPPAKETSSVNKLQTMQICFVLNVDTIAIQFSSKHFSCPESATGDALYSFSHSEEAVPAEIPEQSERLVQ